MAEFLANNWFWVVLVLLFVGMHSFGGGCCGVGRHAKRKKDGGDETDGQEKSCH